MPPPVSNSVDLDKNWTVCDNTSSSPFYGHCYTELDNFGDGDLELMSTSTDGGLTWSAPIPTAGHDKGLGGQPVVQPNGTVVVPYEDLSGKVSVFRSTNGGASWTKSSHRRRTFASTAWRATCARARCRRRRSPRDGTTFVAWEDCRFRNEVRLERHRVLPAPPTACTGAPSVRVPIDAGHERSRPLHPRSGRRPRHVGERHAPGAHVLLLPGRRPAPAAVGSQAGYISSPDGGAHWGIRSS